ncbi:hypothetical protein J2X70_000172 [Stenotrophomonas sp. 1337]|nr:hypothetical protein [Stenotrophomonas sp. 1337]
MEGDRQPLSRRNLAIDDTPGTRGTRGSDAESDGDKQR